LDEVEVVEEEERVVVALSISEIVDGLLGGGLM
jgi:hypothetical protein